MSAPLAGVRVLELAAYTTGPLAARYLSNLGAEVVGVPRDRGRDDDPARQHGDGQGDPARFR